MTEDSIVENLESKLKSQNTNIEFLSAIHDFLYYHKDPNWNLNDVNVIGVGEIVQSNNKLIHGSLDTLNYLDDNHNVLILQNQNQDFCCMVVPPSSTNRNQTNDVFFFGHPVFDKIDTEFADVGQWMLENEYAEQIQITPYGFKRPCNLYNMLPINLQKANDIIADAIKNGKELPLSEVAAKVFLKTTQHKR